MAGPLNRMRILYAAVVSVFFTLMGWLVSTPPLGAATTERIVTDYHTGLAIGGFDPVAYFAKSKALIGRTNIETRFAGATWRFSNEGNREAFADRPEVYMPAFGGYDPMGIVRGVAVPGHPEVWLIIGTRLYLFHNPQTRDAFAAAPDALISAANRQWPELQSKLVQ
jgi:YHS domain-containing protein